MQVKLRKMNVQEFDAFYTHSINDYAKDLMKEQEVAFEDALYQAKTEFSKMLPDGLDTRNNALMVIEDLAAGRTVGVIWYLYETTDGINQVFLSDFVIKEEERRKGYATAALQEMEHGAETRDFYPR